MERRYQLNRLLDFYGALLTDHAFELLRLRLEEDMSLQEIADNFGISRQAVHDSLNRSEKQLEEYEEKLGLIARFEKVKVSVYECEQELKAAREALDKAQKIINSLD